MLVWGCAPKTKLVSLQSKQNKIIKIISNINMREDARQAYKDLNLFNIDKIFIFQCAKFMYKFNNKLLPSIIDKLFPEIPHHIHTRSSLYNYQLPNIKTNFGRNSPSFFCISIWNAIDNDIKGLPFRCFKSSIYDMLVLQ